MIHEVTLDVNGRQHRLAVKSQETLLEALRDRLKLFGARESCGMSLCGACTVLVDELPVSSCSYLAARAESRRITTVEGLADGQNVNPVQQAFLEHGAFQCSYCTPGFLLATRELLDDCSQPSRAEIRDALAGNLCRCGSYVKIEAAVLDAAQRRAASEPVEVRDGGVA